MKKRVKHTVWSSRHEQIETIMNDCSFQEWCEENGIDNDEYTRQREAEELNNEYLDDERINLNVDVHNAIIAIADLGLWDGRRIGYRMIGSGNISDCLHTGGDIYDVEWYCGSHDFRATMWHHDGVDEILYRARKDNVTDYQWDNFLYMLYTGKADRKDITRYTKSLQPFIARVYGWKYRVYPKTNYMDRRKFVAVPQEQDKKAA